MMRDMETTRTLPTGEFGLAEPIDPTPRVGMTFTQADTRRYLENGTRGEHHTVKRYRITTVTDTGLEADEVEVLEENGRPSFAGERLTTARGTRSLIWLGWDAAVKRGDIVLECDWQVVYWGSEADYRADIADGGDWFTRATCSVAVSSRAEALEELNHPGTL